jgi:TonB family protein
MFLTHTRAALLTLAFAGGSATGLPCGAFADEGLIPARVDMARPHLQPAYPDGAQVNGEQGTVVMDVYVNSDGRPTKARITRSTGFDDLDNAAMESVLNWRFVPAERAGDTVSDWTRVQIEFQLPQAPVMTPASMPGAPPAH